MNELGVGAVPEVVCGTQTERLARMAGDCRVCGEQ